MGFLSTFIQLIDPKNKYISRICPVEEFTEIIDREFAHVDRYGDVCSMIVINVSSRAESNKKFWDQTAELLSDRLRPTDEIGWLNNNEIGILLPGTSMTGAEVLFKKLHKNNMIFHYLSHIAILSYPKKNMSSLAHLDRTQDISAGFQPDSAANTPIESNPLQTHRKVPVEMMQLCSGKDYSHNCKQEDLKTKLRALMSVVVNCFSSK